MSNLQQLRSKRLLMVFSAMHSRAVPYRHNFDCLGEVQMLAFALSRHTFLFPRCHWPKRVCLTERKVMYLERSCTFVATSQ